MSKRYLKFLKSNDNPDLIDWNAVYRLVFHKDYEVRMELTEALVFIPGSNSEFILTYLANDSSPWVRSSACDSLCFGKSEAVLIFLINKMSFDSDKIVRSYAAMSAGDVLHNCALPDDKRNSYISMLETRFNRENSSWTKISIAYALIANHQPEYLEFIADKIKTGNFHMKIASLNTLVQLSSDYSVTFPDNIIDSLRSSMATEQNQILLDKYNQLNIN